MVGGGDMVCGALAVLRLVMWMSFFPFGCADTRLAYVKVPKAPIVHLLAASQVCGLSQQVTNFHHVPITGSGRGGICLSRECHGPENFPTKMVLYTILS